MVLPISPTDSSGVLVVIAQAPAKPLATPHTPLPTYLGDQWEQHQQPSVRGDEDRFPDIFGNYSRNLRDEVALTGVEAPDRSARRPSEFPKGTLTAGDGRVVGFRGRRILATSSYN
jgi:hypothetical protein